MGAANVAAVYAYWKHLDHAPVRLLAYMALITYDHAKDGKPARTYWGGREALAEALGHKCPPEGDAEAEEQRKRAFRNLAKTISVLARAGAVTLVQKPAPGKNAVYRVELNASTSGNRTLLPEVTNASTSGGSTLLPQVVPEEEGGAIGEREDRSGGFPAQPQTARENEREPQIDHGRGELTPVPDTKRTRTKPAPLRNRGRQLPLVATVTPEPDEDPMRAHLRELLDRPADRPPAPAATGPACPQCEVLLDPDQQCRNITCQPSTASPAAPPATPECACGVLLDPDRVCRNPTHRSTG